MKIWLNAVVAGAVIASGASQGFARGMAMGVPRPVAAHGFRTISPNPLRFAFAPFVFRPAFPQEQFGSARFEGWSGGAYSADVAASEDVGLDPDNIYFRVQEPFGPGDLGRPQPPEFAGDDDAWVGPRLPPPYPSGPGQMDDR